MKIKLNGIKWLHSFLVLDNAQLMPYMILKPDLVAVVVQISSYLDINLRFASHFRLLVCDSVTTAEYLDKNKL